jgi:hypothetical protein
MPSDRLRIIPLILALSATVLLAACAHRPPASLTWHTTAQAMAPARVAVVPAWLGAGVGRSAQGVTDSLTASLRELGKHQVITLTIEQRDRLMPTDALLSNQLSPDALLRIRDAVQADAIVVARVEQFDAYDPIAIGMVVHMVSCHDGAKLWDAAGHFDGRRAEIQADVEHWHSIANGAAGGDLAGWRGTLASPQAFTRYVTDRLVWTLEPVEE